jgi:pimeloyl-ACP methyl ester carboxylesterase
MPVDAISPDELLELWRRQAFEQAQGEGEEEDEFGGIAGGAPTGGPGAALSLGDIVGLPRDFARTFTVLQMKDRAVRVGGSGVSALLQDVLAHSPARTHLLGHSYGCIVMLSALAAAPAAALPRKVDSVLLLQAAVSRYCFAAKVPQKDYPGGYRVDLGRVAQPVLATYSKRDGPLTSLFHLAVRRDADLGQPTIAGAPKAPSKYAALGGFGPDGCQDGECDYRAIHAVGQDYALGAGDPRIIALQADDAIKGHGDISVPETWWALYNQVRAS